MLIPRMTMIPTTPTTVPPRTRPQMARVALAAAGRRSRAAGAEEAVACKARV